MPLRPSFSVEASAWERWRYAAKPASWPKLLVPSVFGHALGVSILATPMWGAVAGAAVFGLVFTTLDLLAIVFLNDWGDCEVDAIKRRMFPDGCSPKTIPDGILPARVLLCAGVAAALLLVVTSALGGVALARPYLLPLGIAAALTFQAYSFAPLRLNYRGGGEVVEALGVGVLLPWVGAYAQSGLLWHPAYGLLIGAALLSFGSALASGLADELSDAAGGKRTFTTVWGNQAVRTWALLCLAAGALAWCVAGAMTASLSAVAALGGGAVVLWHAMGSRRLSHAAVTNAFAAQGLFKHRLHLSIWWGMATIAVLQLLCSDRV